MNSDGFLEKRLERVVREIVGKLRQLDGRAGKRLRAPRLRMLLRGRMPDALGGPNVEPVRGSALGAVRGGGHRLRASGRDHRVGSSEGILGGRHRDVVGVQDDGVLPPRPRICARVRDGHHRECLTPGRLGGNAANGRADAQSGLDG